VDAHLAPRPLAAHDGLVRIVAPPRDPVLDLPPLPRLDLLVDRERLVLGRDDAHLRRTGRYAAHLEAPVGVRLGCDARDVDRGARHRRARPALDDATGEYDRRLGRRGWRRAAQDEVVAVGDLHRRGHSVDLGGPEPELLHRVQRCGSEPRVRSGVDHHRLLHLAVLVDDDRELDGALDPGRLGVGRVLGGDERDGSGAR
jgi:hypothetical protein